MSDGLIQLVRNGSSDSGQNGFVRTNDIVSDNLASDLQARSNTTTSELSELERVQFETPSTEDLLPELEVVRRSPLEDFSHTFDFQNVLADKKRKDGSLPDYLIVVEHDHVYTTGRNEPFQSAVPDVKWVEINRGGQATYHGPGQLVAYPIFDLTRHGKDVHLYLRKLEEVLIQTLLTFDVHAYAREGLTGVWLLDSKNEQRKIASLGVGVSKWVSYHGLALNLTTDLKYFQAMSPCGQPGEVMTSLQQIFSERGLLTPSWEEVEAEMLRCLVEVFRFRGAVPRKKPERAAKPKWLKVKAPGSPEYLQTREVVKRLKLVTVCEEAHCPNIGECWSHSTATFMIMGELCTRRCSFCAVKDGTLANLEPLDTLEPVRVARAVQELNLKHIVITSVDRDDVSDMGADHFNKTVRAIRRLNPETNIELLIPDMRGRRELVEAILESGFVSVLNHNVETVPRLYREVRPGANFQRSLDVLRWARDAWPNLKTKSGVMLGLGETKEEVLEVMDRLREADVNIMTIGQYLQPSEKQLPIQRYVTPEEFAEYKVEGLKRGFSYVESGALVRSSYHAWQHSADSEQASPTLVAAS